MAVTADDTAVKRRLYRLQDTSRSTSSLAVPTVSRNAVANAVDRPAGAVRPTEKTRLHPDAAGQTPGADGEIQTKSRSARTASDNADPVQPSQVC